MKRFLLVITCLITSFISFAAHIIGGEMRYTYVGPGIAPNSKVYRLTLILFKGDDPTGAPLAGSYVVGIFNNDNNLKFPGTAANQNWLVTQEVPPGIQSVPIVFPTCITSPPVLSYTYAVYSTTVELPDTRNGYTVAYQTCCRINGIVNVGNSIGSTYSAKIPGSDQLGSDGDNAAQFALPVNVICENTSFTLNFSAVETDPDDSLSYRLCDAFNGGAATDAGFANPAPPPYGLIPYNAPFSAADPFGTGATIDPITGIISGTAPGGGKYVVSVCVDVFRSGVYITTHRKDLIVQVSNCQIPTATPMASFVTCDGFNVGFMHTSIGANSVFWDFGDPTRLDDTSNIGNPTWPYTDTGIYTVKFVINRGTSCADSVYRTVGVYPGFSPGFTVTGSCFTNPFQFTDTSKTTYGVINYWSWNFGDGSTLADTSHIQNPQWIYPSSGVRTVSLIVNNSKGCTKTVSVPVTILDKPPLAVDFADSLICIPDAVTLGAVGSGTFSWSPPINIINANTANPTVNPTSDTWYYVDMNDNGCLNRDSVHVRVVAGVNVTAMADTTICETDQVQLRAVTNGLNFQWTPAASLDDPTKLNPIATPPAGVTTYTLRSIIGSCFNIDDITVSTVPYPVADAGPGPVLCYNTSGQLNASQNGTRFTWTPTSYMNDPTVLNPIVTPPRTTTYVLTVHDDVSGCPKPSFDTVIVTVRPKVLAFAGRDTTVVIGQPLQFNASGGVGYLWSPSTGLSADNIPDPIGTYGSGIDSVRYKVIVTDAVGCADSAFVLVRVWKTNPYVFVPTAFTPNNDGNNDVFRPIAVGMAKINYFSVYNRWGQLLFTTTTNGKQGWDGRVNGRLQNTGVFVWMVSAVDYLGKSFFLKGTVALIR